LPIVGQGFEKVIGHDPRTVLDGLAEQSGQTLFEICSRLSMNHGLGNSRQAISQHLAVLEAAGLVGTRRERLYRTSFAVLRPSGTQEPAERARILGLQPEVQVKSSTT
jgi:DNA-binding transcriptional ArsR family regulator